MRYLDKILKFLVRYRLTKCSYKANIRFKCFSNIVTINEGVNENSGGSLADIRNCNIPIDNPHMFPDI